MSHVTIPQDTFERLCVRAAALNITVDDLVKPVVDQLAEFGAPAPSWRLTGDAWRARSRPGSEMPKAGPIDTRRGSSSMTAVRPCTASGKTPNFDPLG